jgi:hypothetical protein
MKLDDLREASKLADKYDEVDDFYYIVEKDGVDVQIELSVFNAPCTTRVAFPIPYEQAERILSCEKKRLEVALEKLGVEV